AGKRLQFVLPDGPCPHVAMRLDDAGAKDAQRSEAPDVVPPDIDMPHWLSRVADELDAQVAGISATLERNAVVHDFDAGRDMRLPLLLKLYVAGRRAIRSGVIECPKNTPQNDVWIKAVAEQAQALYLDRLVVVGSSAFPAAARDAARFEDRIRLYVAGQDD